MHITEIHIENFRVFGEGQTGLHLNLNSGLNVLVGENDAGKSSIIDGIRLALGTTSQDFFRIEDSDFHVSGTTTANQFTITCKFGGITKEGGGPLMEHLTYEGSKPCLYVTFRAIRNDSPSARRRVAVEIRSGRDGKGPQIDGPVRLLLLATYLRPLRDADRELAAGKNSRLSQILQHAREIREHRDENFDPVRFVADVTERREVEFPRSIVNVSKLADHLIKENEGVKSARARLDSAYLKHLHLADDDLGSTVSVAAERNPEQRLRAVLEKLDLSLTTLEDAAGNLLHGLGYSNLLFMACELLLLGQEEDTLPLLLIEEPEAHLHPQLQLRLVEFLQEQTALQGRNVQVLITTHSPNLTSKVKLENLILMCKGQTFPMGAKYSMLSDTDNRFLERFLDVTKANLFFARGVLIVEGDAENLLVPTIARLLDRDFSRHGVSVVNVGNRGLRRYARIFRRRPLPDGGASRSIPVRVACLADRDIMPDCARDVLGLGEKESKAAATTAGRPSERRGGVSRFESELQNEEARVDWRERLCKDDGENVKTFVADHWTLEYDLARAGLLNSMQKAIVLAREEQRMDRVPDAGAEANCEKLLKEAIEGLEAVKRANANLKDARERTACEVVAPVVFRRGVSKAVTAQHLASILDQRYGGDDQTKREELRRRVPQYIQDAISYVTGRPIQRARGSERDDSEANASPARISRKRKR